MSEKKERSKIDPIVQTEPKIKKKGFLSKLAEDFFYDSFETMAHDVKKDIIIPSIKNAVCDILTSALRTGPTKRSSGASRISYNNYSSYRDQFRRERDIPERSARGKISPNEVLFQMRGDAELVLDTLEEQIDRDGSVSVADFYDMANVPSNMIDYTDSYYGWTNLRSAVIKRAGYRDDEGWVIKFPRPIHID